MGEKIAYWVSIICSIGALAFLVLNAALIISDRHLQQTIAMRQTAINQGVALSQANKGLTEALADAAVKNNDTAIRELLTSQGITINTPSSNTTSSVDKKK